MKGTYTSVFCSLMTLLLMVGAAFAEEKEVCIKCNRSVTPLLVKDWHSSEHTDNDVTYST